jgi:ATP-binding cassette, subfamily B, bacterial CvaB/MchF/RaxB
MSVVELSQGLLGSRGRLPIIQQSQMAECGLACLAMVARYHGHDLDLPSLRRRFPASIKGLSLARMIEVAERLGFEARPLKLELDALAGLRIPCILHWNLNHFVVLKRVSRRRVEIHDPDRGQVIMSLEQASEHFTGVALELSPASNFQPITERRRFSLRQLIGRVHGLYRAMGLVLILALALEVFTLVMPLAMQLVIDQVLVSADADFLTLIGIGFLVVVGMQALTTAMRGWVLATLSASLNAQWVTNLFGHLLKLPMAYFESRHIGGVMSRLGSLTSIQQTLTSSFIEALLNGLTVIFVLAVMLLYSVQLTLLVIVGLGLYLAIRALAYRHLHKLSEEVLVFTARQQTQIIETVRGMQAIKLANKQAERRGRVSNATVEMANRQAALQRYQSNFNALNQLIFGGLRIVLIWVGASLVLAGDWTIGVLVVFLAYSQMFMGRAGALVDCLVEFKLLALHGERIADIALESPEAHQVGRYIGPEPSADLELRKLGFRYGDDESWVLRELDLRIEAGESVAIVGPSGCGKTTLARLMLGLLEPDEGSIFMGGVDIRNLGLSAYRDYLAAVMQDDDLFAGSLADNIAFFDPQATITDIERAARLACIHDDITAMPMGYETLVGDMGAALSGGQMQRVLVARALFRRPRILLLDEATSHLDTACERQVSRAISGLNMTRIIIAHRPETIASADRVIELGSVGSFAVNQQSSERLVLAEGSAPAALKGT